jgi:hypothetical protein
VERSLSTNNGSKDNVMPVKQIMSASLFLLLSFLMAFPGRLSAQDADNRPLVAVYPIKRPSDVQTNAQPMNAANEAVFEYLDRWALDPNIIVLNIEDGLRKGKKVKLFERGSAGMDSIRQEQFKAECGNNSSGGQGANLAKGQTITPGGQIIDECLKRFAGNAAATGQLANVEFIVDIAIMDVAISDAIYRPIPEMPGKFRRSVNCKVDIAVKVLDSTTGQVKFQALVPATYTESGIAQDKSEAQIDRRAVWNGLATEAGRKAAAAINGAIKS